MKVVATDDISALYSQLKIHYRIYVLAVLVVVGICSWTDRQIFSILLESIKHEFSLSDTQLGVIGGTAFSLFYVSVGLPIAWLADRASRRNIIAAAIALWSTMTYLCSFATGYGSLFLCRMGVGIGEAGGAAPSQSLVSDYFPERHRAFAMGVLYSYMPMGYLVSYSLGGWLNDAVGWRQAFVLFGLPGLLLALLVRLTVREPSRDHHLSPQVLAAKAAAPSFASTLKYFMSRRSLRYLPLAGAAHGIGMFAAAVWMPAYFMRTFNMTSSQIGVRLALIMGIAGLAGVLIGGYLVDRLVARTNDARWYTWSCSLFLLGTVPFTVAIYMTRDPQLALLLFIVPTLLSHMFLGPVVATMQNLAGIARRAMAAAFYLFLVNLIAASLGPLLIGFLSDLFNARYGNDSLRYSLLFLIASTSTLAAVFLYLASRTIREDMAQARLPPA